MPKPEKHTGASTVNLGPSSEAQLPGQQSPAPAPGGTPAVTTAEAERQPFEAPQLEPEPEPEPAADRLAVGSHVVAPGVVGAPALFAGARYGIVLEVVALPGATEPAYRVGWLDTSGGLLPESALQTTAEYAERGELTDDRR